MNISRLSLRHKTVFFLGCAFIALFFLSIPSLIFAQEEGLSMSPAIIEETLEPGIHKDYSVKLKNLNKNDQLFYIFTRNISGVADGGVPVFAKNDNEITGYELADWIKIPVGQITIPGDGSATLDFSLDVPQNASPGSHFGGLFFSVEPPEIANSGAAVGYQVVNILSIRVAGEVVEEASIRQFSTSKFLYGSQNVEFDVRIENSGNVLIRPIGPIEVFNMLGSKVGTVIFNQEQHGVFPNSTREFTNIVWKGDTTGFGRYEAILSPSYGDDGAKKTISSTVSFWILPMHIIGPALGVFGFILLVAFIFVRLYIRRSLAQLNYGRRIVRKRKNNSSALLLFTVVILTVTALFLIVLLVLFA